MFTDIQNLTIRWSKLVHNNITEDQSHLKQFVILFSEISTPSKKTQKGFPVPSCSVSSIIPKKIIYEIKILQIISHVKNVQQQLINPVQLIDRVKVLCSTRHNIGYFGEVSPSQSLGLVWKKTKPNTKKHALINQKKCTTTQNKHKKTKARFRSAFTTSSLETEWVCSQRKR